MTVTPLGPLDESHRWSRADWLSEADDKGWLDAGFRVVDMIQARADGDNDRLKALCCRADLTTPVVAKAAFALLGIVTSPENLPYLRDDVVNNGADYAAVTKTGLGTVHRLEAVAIAECYYSDDRKRAMELAIGSDTPPHAHLVAAVILLERMLRGQTSSKPLTTCGKCSSTTASQGGC